MDSLDKLEKTINEWFRLADVYYRKFSICKYAEPLKKINFNACHIAVAKNGGLIAFVKKSKHFIMDVNNPIKDSILVFHQNGIKESEPIKFEEKGTIVLFEFTNDEDLILLLSDGRLYHIDIYCMSYECDYIGLAFGNDPIVDAKLFEKGIMCLTESGNFYYNFNIKDPSSLLFFSIRQYVPDYMYFNYMANVGTSKNTNTPSGNKAASFTVKSGNINTSEFFPSDFLVVPTSVSGSGKIELYFPHQKNGLYQYIEGEKQLKYIKRCTPVDVNTTKTGLLNDNYAVGDLGKVLKLVASPNMENVAFFNTDAQIFVFPSNMIVDEANSSNTNLINLSQPFQLLWCSEDCVVASGQGSISLIGPENIVKTFFTKNNTQILSEVDGIRIITDEQVEFLQTVPQDLIDTILYISVDPARKLLVAYKSLEENKPNCDQELRSIRGELADAVNKIISAATCQWDVDNEIYLMKVAQHGKTFLSKEEFSFNYFVTLCKDLRIINNLRKSDKPRFISYNQYKKLELKQLVNRLIKMHNFHLAFEIYHYFGFNVKEIYERWAIAFIKVRKLFNYELIKYNNNNQNRIFLKLPVQMKKYSFISKFKENLTKLTEFPL